METSASFAFVVGTKHSISQGDQMNTVRANMVNGLVALGLSVAISLAWVGSQMEGGLSRLIGSMIFYTGVEIAVWFVLQPLVERKRAAALAKIRPTKQTRYE
jgi:hypothetical protein